MPVNGRKTAMSECAPLTEHAALHSPDRVRRARLPGGSGSKDNGDIPGRKLLPVIRRGYTHGSANRRPYFSGSECSNSSVTPSAFALSTYTYAPESSS